MASTRENEPTKNQLCTAKCLIALTPRLRSHYEAISSEMGRQDLRETPVTTACNCIV